MLMVIDNGLHAIGDILFDKVYHDHYGVNLDHLEPEEIFHILFQEIIVVAVWSNQGSLLD